MAKKEKLGLQDLDRVVGLPTTTMAEFVLEAAVATAHITPKDGLEAFVVRANDWADNAPVNASRLDPENYNHREQAHKELIKVDSDYQWYCQQLEAATARLQEKTADGKQYKPHKDASISQEKDHFWEMKNKRIDLFIERLNEMIEAHIPENAKNDFAESRKYWQQGGKK